MASKGSKSSLEPIARQLYAGGMNLSEISEQIPDGPSVTSLSRWKKETTDPVTGIDAWDMARRQKEDTAQGVRKIVAGYVAHVAAVPFEKHTSKMADVLVKYVSSLERLSKIEQVKKVADKVEQKVKDEGITPETIAEVHRLLGIS